MSDASPTDRHVLVLGGTAWLGGAVARHALSLGHHVTCLARGASGHAPHGASFVAGDRDAPSPETTYGVLAHQDWDLVVDVARRPAQVRGALEALSDRAARWAFVSSGSVYADHSIPGGGIGDVPLPLLPPGEDPEGSPEAYGGAKVACENAVRRIRGDDALVARSGLIAGDGDPSDRFGYWVGRLALATEDGGPVLVPEHLEALPAQWLDVADLAAWLVEAGLGGTTGTVDAYGPRRTLDDVVRTGAMVAGFDGKLVPASDTVLTAAGVEEFMGPRSLALWMSDPAWRGFSAHSDVSAVAAGIRARSVEETTRAALATERRLGLGRTGRRAGLDRDDELVLIRTLREG